MLCVAIMILWLVAFPGFLTVSTVLRIVNTESFVVPATVLPYFLIIGRYPYFHVVGGLEWSDDPESYAGSSIRYQQGLPCQTGQR